MIEAKRHCSDTTFTPKWKRVDDTKASLKSCVDPHCTNKFHEKLIQPAFATITKFEELLGVQSTADNPLLLCPTCYSKLYHQFNPVYSCTSCGAIPKSGYRFCRHSPDAALVSQYFKDTTNTDVIISPNDWICTNCYKTHTSIIKSLECKENGTDEMLTNDIQGWEDSVKSPNNNKLTKAILASVIFVAWHLLPQKAVLLPRVCQVFLETYGVQSEGDIKSIQVTLEVEESSVMFSSRWLLHQLIAYLDVYMMHKCVHMKFGTVLFRKGADLLVSLSWALGSLQFPQWSEPSEQQKHAQHPNTEKTLEEAGIIINDLIHKEIKKSQLSDEYCTSIRIDEYLNNVNPLLLNFLISITNTVRDREVSNNTKQIKKIRLFFILCQLMFCTNPQHPTPIHNLIADTIEICGGSRQLMRILNRLGCASSPDTHDRFVTHHAMAQRQANIWDEIPSNSFTIASVDNFDMLQSYSSVYYGDQQRSYHGTTLQLVQPNSAIDTVPLHDVDVVTMTPVDINVTTQSYSPTIEFSLTGSPLSTRKLIRQQERLVSPDKSPHKLGKVGPKRQRTVAVKSLASTLQPSHHTVPQLTLTLESFLENAHESNEKKILKNKIFSYVVQKHVLHHHHDTDLVPEKATLSDIRVFLDDNSDCDQPTSTVHYMELVDENPDSTETMALVAEDLLATFDAVQDGWVVLVGDGKTYKHLMNIKKQYSAALSKLLIFPGDWHILKNYQPVLMKIYYCAGLKELAKNSGYHGSTLKSLEQSSNFKRTHHFLLQTWEALYREMLQVYITKTGTTITEDASCILMTSIQTKKLPRDALKRITELVNDTQTNENFMKFVEEMGKTDKTWRFWAQFVFR